VRSVARGGLLNLIGAAVNGLSQFLLVVAVTRALHGGQAGAFFEAIALFMILSNTCELGADTGLTRMIPRLRVQSRIADVRAVLGVGIWPSLASGILFAIAVYVFAAPLAEIFTHHREAAADRVAEYIRIMAIFLPVSCVYTVAVAGTRGFGTMMPNALIDRVARSSVQLLLVVAVLLVSDRPSAIAVAWSLPFAAGLVAAGAWLLRLLHRVERRAATTPQEPATPLRRLYGEFWRYTAPRGLTGAFQITIVWVGTLMVGSLLSTSSASVYTASTRYLVAGTLVNTAILQVIAPKLAELLSAGLGDRAKDVYQLATACLITIAWPMYFTLALFAPVLLSAFGHDYRAGVSSLAILSVAMLVATGIGPVDVVLLMGGRSTWNLFNVVMALILNLVLGLVLIPRIGIAGAAVGLAGAILFNNVAPLLEVRAFLRVHPFGRAFLPVAASAALCFGGLGSALRLTVGESVPVLFAYLAVASLGYAAMLYGFRERIELPLLWQTLARRRDR
jgi:O-antigen/teichoic acid export membrane protein